MRAASSLRLSAAALLAAATGLRAQCIWSHHDSIVGTGNIGHVAFPAETPPLRPVTTYLTPVSRTANAVQPMARATRKLSVFQMSPPMGGDTG